MTPVGMTAAELGLLVVVFLVVLSLAAALGDSLDRRDAARRNRRDW